MSYYDEIEIEDMEYNADKQIYTYPCPCGDRFQISLEDLWDGEDVASCPSCTLRILVVYDEENLPTLQDDEGDDDDDIDKTVEEVQDPTSSSASNLEALTIAD